ncbi:type II secretion system F family protein [Streptomonospora wellingtoniae]|uniref:Type II secretion system F family protein n=1 Tax=Streptomonospora wellingtoniae TaxID=3075544 RepID=A0ABU2KY68_9ACTN|nr:type II secretion system F family protein [Streptomonospora sp. DSM 45055]MDT0304033.1 type II secretion system F family protein [Streptomonospora sp. DSM 45055]
MGLVEVSVIALGTAAVLLLRGGSARSRALRRLRRLRPPDPPRPAHAHGVPLRLLLHWGVPCAPAATLLLAAGPLAAILVGVPIAAALRWRLAQGDRHTVSRADRARVLAGLPVAVDLLVSGLRAGGALEDALGAVAMSLRGPLGRSLGEVAEQLRLGAEPRAAWAAAADTEEFAAIGRALARASESGAPVAAILERHAAEIRDTARVRALARTQRLGVLSAAPLGLCFLPAFVLIGVVPLAASLISGLTLP